MEATKLLRACQCGQRTRLNTLEYDLNNLIHRHSLPEVLDRLCKMAFEQSQLDPGLTQNEALWTELASGLEKATEAALELATLKEREDQQLWK
jgi:hypothetical protein